MIKEVEIIRVKKKSGFIHDTFECEEIIKDMYRKGYSYKGYVPVSQGGYGGLVEIDLIFEQEY